MYANNYEGFEAVAVPVHNEEKCQFVSTTGLARICDQVPIFNYSRYPIYSWNFDNKPCSLIYVQPTHLIHLLKSCQHFNQPFAIVATGDDMCWPNDPYFFRLNTRLEIEQAFNTSPNLVAIFAQNAIASPTLPRLFSIPIGLDYHTINWSLTPSQWGGSKLTATEQEQTLLECQDLAMPIEYVDPCTVVTNFQLAMDSPERRKAFREPLFNLLKNVEWMKFLPSSTRKDFWLSLDKVAFCLCPPGNGYDTHRTWEVLAMGRFPIIQKLPINSIFQDLPVWEVEDWEQFASLTKQDLRNKYEQMKKQTYNLSKLTLAYWEQYMRDTVKKLMKD